jgi:rhamnulokinase
VREGLPSRAHRLLLIPDLVHAFLTGESVSEFTNASTTQLLSVASGTWDTELMSQLDLPWELFAPVVPSGSVIGALRPDLAKQTGFACRRVVAPATHDTGSAVAGTPLRPGWAFISSGTWSLVGIERDRPLVNADVSMYNFTNEGGAHGTVRLLKNVTGLWLLESCRREWAAQGHPREYKELLDAAALVSESPGLVFPDDPRFLNPPSMLAAIATQLRETGQPQPADPGAVTRVILDSLALRYSSVIATIESLTGACIEGVHVVGGGSQNAYLNQATATATGKTVAAGPVEATVIGNIMVQAVTAGCFATLADARRYVSTRVQLQVFTPAPTASWDRLRERYSALESRLLPACVS